ncbi:MAG: FG-GAP-like repeat-containing protein [Elusimicrobiota bacterium]
MTADGGASGGGTALAGAVGALPAGPGLVDDIAVGVIVSTGLGASSMTATLTWTAPAAGAAGGENAFYDLRYDTNPILTQADYDNAPNSVLFATAVVASAAESAQIEFLDAAATHYFAVSMIDNFGLKGGVSNAATALAYVTSVIGGINSRGVAWGDYDGDGDLDFIVAKNGDEYIGKNNGDGTFSPFTISGSGMNSLAVAWCDVDRDGDLDAVLANAGNESILRNDGGDNFTTVTIADTADTSNGIACGDYDNDGDMDLVVGNTTLEDYVATNNGIGGFSTAPLTGTAVNTKSVAWADYDNDGDLDFVAAANLTNDYIAKNNGDGTFSTFTFTAYVANSEGIAWGDYDGDGKLDIAIANNGNTAVYHNDGGDAFTEIQIADSGGNSLGIAWADYDNDNDLDLLVANSLTEQYILSNSDGAGTFVKVTLTGFPGTTYGVSWGDYDDDGDLDAVVGNDSATEDDWVYRNDLSVSHSAPSVPAGLTQYFDEFGAASSSGVLRLEWNEAADTETTDTDLLEYIVRVGTSAENGEIMPYPARFSQGGYGGAGFPYSTRGSTVTGKRGLRLVLPKETTVYWAVGAVDAEFTRSSTSTEQVAWLAAPAAISDLAAVYTSTGLGASSMTVTLTWTAPGANGGVGALAGGAFDLRYSTVGPIMDLMNYSTVSYQVMLSTSVSPGEPQSHTVEFLNAAVTHYFAITTIDEYGVRSALSNPTTALSYMVALVSPYQDSGDIAWGDYNRDGRLDLAAANDNKRAALYTQNADGSFTADSAGTETKISFALAWGDYDNDGDLDLAMANSSAGDEYVVKNNNGEFEWVSLDGSLGDSLGIAWGDYDNDGDLDLAVANDGQDNYIASNTAGAFSTFTVTSDGAGSTGVSWGDFNNDGYLDFAFANYGGDVVVGVNNGDGTISTAAIASSGGNSYGLAWGDYDADGYLDLAVVNDNENVYLLHNNGAGGFAAKSEIPNTDVAGRGIVWGDANNDGKLDLAIAVETDDEVVLFGDGAGGFTKITLVGTGHSSTAVSWGDADGDGDLDLAVSNDTESEFVLRNDIIAAHTPPTPPASGFSARYEEFSEFSSSGTLTLMWGHGADAETTDVDLLEYFVQVGTTVAGSSTTMRIPEAFGASGTGFLYSTRGSTDPARRGIKLRMQAETTAYWAVVPMDAELMRGATSAEQTTPVVAPRRISDLAVSVTISTAIGASSMTARLSWTAPGDDGGIGAIMAGEYDIRYSSHAAILTNADFINAAASFRIAVATSVNPDAPQTYDIPFLDRATTHYFAITTKDGLGVRSALSNAATAFSYIQEVVGTADASYNAAWADIDGDGDLDFVVANYAALKVKAVNNGDGTFTQSAIAGTAGSNTRGLAWGDMDNDGDLDAVLANDSDQAQTILVNDGNGNFSVYTLADTNGYSQGVAVADFDNDGDLDFVTSESAQDYVVLHTNLGGLYFSSATVAGGGTGSRGVTAGDMDNDGDMDIVVANNTGGANTMVLKNNGDGTFSETELTDTGGYSNGIALGDYDGDGDLDIAVANAGSGDSGEENYILRNNGGLSFTKITLVNDVQVSHGALWGDANNDGRLDAAFVNELGEDAAVWLSQGGDVFARHALYGTGGSTHSLSWGDFDDDGDLDLLLVSGPDTVGYIVRNDTSAANTAPSAPSGLTATFSEYSLFADSGVLTLKWSDATDTQTSTAALRYYVRIGTTTTGSSTTLKIPPRFGYDGYSGGGLLYSTRLSGLERGFKIEMQKETTVYWSLITEDGALARSGDSGEQEVDLSIPRAVTDLTAAIDNSVQSSSVAWVALSFTAPGENGNSGNLQAGALFDVRWSTVGPISSDAEYEGTTFKSIVSAAGAVQGSNSAWASVAVSASSKTYYFAMTTLDQFGARSVLSNSSNGVFPKIMRERVYDLAETSILQDQTTGFLRIDVWTDGVGQIVKWEKLRVKKIGSLPDGAIKLVGLWNDLGSVAKTFDDSDSKRTANAVFTSSEVVLTFSTPQSIDQTTSTYYLGAQFDPAFLPVDGASIALVLVGDAFVVTQGGVGAVDFPALELDGVDDGAIAPYHATLNVAPDPITVEAWVRTTDGGADRVIVTRGRTSPVGGYRLWLNGDGCGSGVPTLYIGVDKLCANAQDASVRIDDGYWHHVAAAFDNSAGKTIYIDGVTVAVGNTDGVLDLSDASEGGLGIGRSSATLGGLGNPLAGQIDEVRISKISSRYARDIEFIPARRFADGDINSVALYHFDGELDPALQFKDRSNAGSNTLTVVGAVGGYGRSTATAVTDAADVFVASGTDVAPATMFENQKDIAMLRLMLWTENDHVTLDEFFITPLGDGSAVENISLYLDDGDEVFDKFADTNLISGKEFTNSTATFNLAGAGKAQLINTSTKSYFIVWDVAGGIDLDVNLGLEIAATTNFTLSGSTDAGLNLGYPIRSGTPMIVGAEVFVTPEAATGTWINTSSIVFRTNGAFNLGNVLEYRYVWNQNPVTAVAWGDSPWTVGKATATAGTDANDWYFHVRAFASGPTAGTQEDFGPFYVDTALPTGAGFLSYNSTAGALAETQFSDLAADVTAEYQVEDALSGLNLDGPAPVAPDSGTISLWHFDEQSGITWYDAAGPNRNDLSIVAGGMTRTHGRFGSALLFDGVSYLRAVPLKIELPIGNVEFSFESWVFPLSTDTTSGITSWGTPSQPLRIALDSGQLAINFGGGYVARGPVLSTGVWQHIGLTYDGSTCRYYVDGAEVGSNGCGARETGLGELYIGGTDAGELFQGALDEMRILDVALSAGEIYNDYSRGDPYFVSYSTNAGSSWQFIASTDTAAAAHIELSGAHGAAGPETLKVYGLDLVLSTSAQTTNKGTNQVRFHAADRAANVFVAGPFAVLVDTNAPVAVSTPAVPVNGAFVSPGGTDPDAHPDFHWIGPDPYLVSGMAGEFFLEVVQDDDTFAAPLIRISTPAEVSDYGLDRTFGSYLSTFTLTENSTYYWRVRARSGLGIYSPWSQTSSFVTDTTTPTAADFRVFNSTAGDFLESQNIDLLTGVTVQITLNDAARAGLGHFAEYPSTTDVLGYWSFDEVGGANPIDSSGNGNNGTLSCGQLNCSSATYAAGRFGAGISCNGDQRQGVLFPNADFNFPASSTFTLEAWIFPEKIDSNRTLIAMGHPGYPAGRNYVFGTSKVGDITALQFVANTEGKTSSGRSILRDRWQHVAVVVESSRMLFYINGAFDSLEFIPGGVTGGGTMPLSICTGLNEAGAFSSGYYGMIDEVRVVGHALDAEQIAADYTATAAGRFAVEYSTTAGQDWNIVGATYAVPGYPYLRISGDAGSMGPQTLEVRLLDLTHSTSSATGSQGTNQVRFHVPDRAGNTLVTSPYAVIVDTVAAASVATPLFPADGAYSGSQPNFRWAGPSTTTVVQMGTGSVYLLEVDDNPDFFTQEIYISTPVLTQSTSVANVSGLYVSTYTLTHNTTYYWRVRSRNELGLLSPPLTVFTFVTDLSSPVSSGFISYNSTYGAVAEGVVNDLSAGVTVELLLQDSVLAAESGLSTQPVAGARTFGVIYTTQTGQNPVFWTDGGWGPSFSDPSGTAVEALALYGGALYAGTRGGASAPVYKYAGGGWTQAGAALTGSAVKCFAEFNGKLYAGVDGNGRIYSWNGGSWTQEFDTGKSQTNALAVYNGRLYAATGGSGEIWAYDAGTGNWFRVFAGYVESMSRWIDPIYALEVYNGSLFAAGQGGIIVSSGTTFTVSNKGNVGWLSLEVYNNDLYAGNNSGGEIFKFDGAAWGALPDKNTPEASVAALGMHDGRLYAGANGASPGRIYVKDGRDWLLVRQLATGDETRAFQHYNGRLYAGTKLSANGVVYVSTPLATSLTGDEGATSVQTLRAEGLTFTQSTIASDCLGSRQNPAVSCAATNQVRFTAMDRAGNVAAAGPYAVLVDALLSQPTAAYPAAGEFIMTDVPALLWQESPVQPKHEIEIDDDVEMTSPEYTLIVDSPVDLKGIAQVTVALTGGPTYYWHARSYSALGIPSAYTAPNNFIIDLLPPAVNAFQHINSAAGVITESQINNLAAGVTVQLTLQDATAGLFMSTATAVGNHQTPAGGFSVLYSTNAGASWRSLRPAAMSRDGSQEAVRSLAVYNGQLYAGQGLGAGDGDVFVNNGISWSASPAVPNPSSVEVIHAMAVYNGNLYAGQGADAGDGDVLKYDGSWSVSYDGAAGDIRALAVYNGKLYAGQGGAAAEDGDIHVYNGATWSLSTPTASSEIRALAVYKGQLYAGGGTTGIRIFDGWRWTENPGATTDPILAFAVYNGRLYAGTTGGDVRVFNGSAWTASTSTGAGYEILSLAAHGGRLYAGRGGAAAGDGDIYAFDGQKWTLAYDGAAGAVYALAAFNGKLFAGEGSAAGTDGDIRSFAHLGEPAITGIEGSVDPENFTAYLDLVNSTNTTQCGGSGPCGATNQVIFNAADRAGNVLSAGPYAVLVDTSVPLPMIDTLTPLTTRSIFVTANSSDNLSGINDYVFEASTSSDFSPPITDSGFVAIDSHTFTDLLVATTYYFRVTLRDNLLNVSTPSVVSATSTFGTVFYSSAAITPASALQSAVVPMLRLYLNTPTGTSRLDTVRVTLTGSAGDADVSEAQIYRDVDGDGVFDDGAETFLAGAVFTNGVSTVVLAGNAEALDVKVSTVFIAFQMSDFATVNNTVGMDLVLPGDIGLKFPDNAEGPFPTSVPPISITDGANRVTFNETGSYAAQSAAPSQNDVLTLRLNATTPLGSSIIDEIVVHLTGDMPANKITRVVVWRDANGNSVFEPATDDNLTDNIQTFTQKGTGLAVSTVTLSAPQSSRTVVQGGGEVFFVSVDIPSTAGSEQGKGFQLVISTPADIHLSNPADSAALTAYPITASTVTIQINNTVTVSTRSWAPATVVQGGRFVIFGATLTADAGTAGIDQFTVNLNGLAADSDIEAVELYKDKTADGKPFVSPAAETFLGSATFSGGVAVIGIWDPILAGPLEVAQSTTVVFLAYKVAAGASAGRTAGAVITSAGDISTVDPTSSVQGVFPIISPLTQIVETINTLKIPSSPPVNPPNVDQGEKDVKMLSFELVSDNNNITWSGLTIERLGDTVDADVKAIRLWRDTDKNGNIDPAVDVQLNGTISTDTFTGGVATIALDVSTEIARTTMTFIITLDISPDAVPGSSIAVRIDTTTAFSINAPNIVSSMTAAFPIDTPSYVPIQQFANTITVTTTSIVPSGGALPGTQNVGIMHLVPNTDVSTAKWLALQVERLGSSVNSDIAAVKIYYDKTGLGTWNSSNLGAYDLITPSTHTFGDLGLNSVRVSISTPPTLVRSDVSQKGFFLVVDIAAGATPDNTIIVRAQNDSWFEADGLNEFSSSTAKFTSQTLTIAAPPQQMFVVASDTAPASVTQGDTFVPMMELELWMTNYSAKWTRLTVQRAGTGSDDDISAVRIFNDSGTVAGEWDASDTELGAAVFSGGQAVLTFATQTIRTSTAIYHLTYDIDPAAQGTSVGLVLDNSGQFDPLSSPHVTSNYGFPFQSSDSAIARTVTGMNVTGFPAAPGSLLQGATNQPIIGLILDTDNLALLFSAVTVRSSGTAADSDITAVNLWYDADQNGSFSAALDEQLTAGSERFVGGEATLTILPGSEKTIDTLAKTFFVTVDVAVFADDTKKFGAVVLSSDAFTVSSPNFVVDANFPAPPFPPNSPLKKVAEVLTVRPVDTLPAGGVNQSTAVAAVMLAAFASRNSIEWTKLSIEQRGTLDVSSISAVSLYRADASGNFSSGAVLIASTGAFTGKVAELVMTSSETVTTSTGTYYVVLAIAAGAPVDGTVALRIASAGSLTVTKNDTVSSANITPFDTGATKILDVKTPTQPQVTLTDGSFSSNFEHLEFNWNSEVGSGGIIGAEYAIGTSTGANDIYPADPDPNVFAPLSAGDTTKKASGFGMVSGTTYYVSVRVQSMVSGSPTVFTSPVGVSAPILVDFTVPTAPAPNISVSGGTLLFTWSGIVAGPSGIKGYLIEYRTGEVPVWKNVKTGGGAIAQSVSSIRPAVAVADKDVVTGNSYQATGLPKGTLYFRMRAVTGAGQAGPASDPKKLLVGVTGTESISQVSSYPNPFDSRKEKATIHYSLGTTSEVSIEIYSVYGRLVRSLSGTGNPGSNEVVWDGTDDGGAKVSMGIYLAVVEVGGEKTILKIGVKH